MSDSKSAWDDVARRFTEIGRRVGERHRELGPETAGDRATDRVIGQLDRVFTSVGDTLRDPATSSEVKAAVRSLGDALAAAFDDVGEAIRRRVGTTHSGDEPDQRS